MENHAPRRAEPRESPWKQASRMLQRSTAGRNRSGLVRGSGADRQRVDIGRHQLAHRGIDGTVPGQRRHARERLADDADIEMPAPVPFARMARLRSEERRGRKGWVHTVKSRWSLYT